ncbi:MAG TPA: GTP 3',8-cyclase MoaA [bacterium]|nr:GTP 3',8-cyclase MoaA [bacterium]
MVRDQLNRPLRDLRISVTDKCNFRCPYCMPIEVYGEDYEFSPKAEILTFEEVTRLTQLFARAGVQKVRITGGEPLIRKDLTVLISELAAVPGLDDLTLTTNGWFLAQQAAALKQAGLSRVTVSLDALDDAVFGRMNGRGFGAQRVLEGIEAAAAAGLTPVKVNAVLKRTENYEAIVQLAERFRGTGVIVRFIEYMDVGNKNGWRLDEVIPSAEVIAEIHKRWPVEPVEANYRGEVAERYRYRDGQGEIGVISSITQPFCGDCSRGRLTTDGRLVTCLFAAGGRNLRDPMRAGASDEELLGLIVDTWGRRKDRYSEERTENTPMRPRRKIEMYQIGG